ncbi:MAG: phospholipase [Gemmatimonadetes bacterium]|nr:phospholipase [Gemmatimonadota bacterium]
MRRPQPGDGIVSARPGVPSEPAGPGLHRLGLGGGRDALLYVPAGLAPERPAPLVLMLHGAGGDGRNALGLMRAIADEAGVLLLAPDSRGRTWDVILGAYGPDVAFLDRALAAVFDRCAVDAERVAIGGFSDGASYALSLGVANGELFTHVLAFSPGFMAPPAQRGAPRIYVSHGTEDAVLPIDRCSRHVVPRLEAAGYHVVYREFNGPHTVPPDVARQAVDWLLD